MVASNEILDENDLLQRISDGTAAETGSGFFRAVVKNLSQVLGTHGAWITEYLSEAQQLRALAFWLAGDFVDHYVYDIVGTPCEASLKNKTFLHIPENVIELFPGDPEFRIFAARATAELLRLQAEDEIRNREEKLKGLFNGAMDTIVELDHDFNIMMLNPAGEQIFGCKPDECLGKSFNQFLRSKDFDRLHQIVRKLDFRPRGERSVWVPEGLIVLNTGNRKIPTEATISQIEIGGTSCFVLILRDVNDRYEAQKLIESLRDEAEYLKDEIQSLYHLGEIIGESKPFRKTLQLVAEVAPTDSTVLIYGETGTGKELIARAIHDSSLRKDRSLITVNCAAIPETLMESEFFGHEKGAFTGATQRREGRFALADGGTIFLDEVGELNRELQAKLLRVLQEGEFNPVGSSQTRRTDVRVISATNRDLSMAVQEGKFRTDLYYRLNVFPIHVPPLAQRGDDIRLLAEHFLAKFSKRMGRRMDPLSVDCIERLKAYDWPGNVRELQNIIERGVITARQDRLNLDYALPDRIKSENTKSPTPSENSVTSVKTVQQLQQLERENLILALEKSQWRVAGKKGAAQLVGMPPSTFQSRMKALRIKRPH